MNTEDIIRMARQAGMREPGPMSQDSKRFYPNDFAERFAALVEAAARADEREACAKVAEDFLTSGRSPLGRRVAAAIRARSDARAALRSAMQRSNGVAKTAIRARSQS